MSARLPIIGQKKKNKSSRVFPIFSAGRRAVHSPLWGRPWVVSGSDNGTRCVNRGVVGSPL